MKRILWFHGLACAASAAQPDKLFSSSTAASKTAAFRLVTGELWEQVLQFPEPRMLAIGHNLTLPSKTLGQVATRPAMESLHCDGMDEEPRRFPAGLAPREVFTSGGNPKSPETAAVPDLIGATNLTTLKEVGGITGTMKGLEPV